MLIAILVILLGIILYSVLRFAQEPTARTSSAERNDLAAEKRDPNTQTIKVGERSVKVTLADTPNERAQGLSGRKTLRDDEGMLFIFETQGMYGFWMKDMLIPIDIMWISNEGVVVDIHKNVSPATYPSVFRSKVPIKYVLELAAGFFERYNMKVGDAVDL